MKRNNRLSNDDLQKSLLKVSRLYSVGQLIEARSILGKLVRRYQGVHLVWSLNGLVLAQLNHLPKAKESFQKAIKLSPNTHENYTNLGNVLFSLEQFDKAVTNFQKALSIRLDLNAVTGLGAALRASGRADTAVKILDELAHKFTECPDHLAKVVRQLAECHIETGNQESAVKMIEDWSERSKNNVELMFVHAFYLQRFGYSLRAIKVYEAVLGISPKHINSRVNLAVLYLSSGFVEQAEKLLRDLLKEQPKNSHALINYSKIAIEKKDYPKAQSILENLIKDEPKNYKAHLNLGTLWTKLQNFDLAEKAYKAAIKIDDQDANGHKNLGDLYQLNGMFELAVASYQNASNTLPRNSEALASLLHLSSRLCKWDDHEAFKITALNLGLEGPAVNPFGLIPLCDDPIIQLQRAKNWFNLQFGQIERLSHIHKNVKSKKIRLGYFSSDFNKHPVMYLISRVFELHNRDEFEVHGFNLGSPISVEPWPNVESLFDYFHDVCDLSDHLIAKKSQDFGIDIAIDLNGYTLGARTGIFAFRAAPIQINYLGYPGTLGSEIYDFIIADKFVIPDKSVGNYSESVVRLPHCYMPTDDKREIATRVSRSSVGLPTDSFVFCCFNNSYKISPYEFTIWMNVLNSVPESVLWLRTDSETMQANIIDEAKSLGVKKERIIFAERVPMKEHLARYKLADLVLDTFAFNGHTTTADALWAGAPVLTVAGNSFASRVAGSLLKTAGATELICKTPLEYEEKAIMCATHKQKVLDMQNQILRGKSRRKLFNSEAHTRYLEQAFKIVYQMTHDAKKQKIIDISDNF